jgi:hypothetical protein
VEAFGVVLIVVCVLAVIAAAISYWGTGNIYKGLGRSGQFSIDDEDPRPSPTSPAEAREELRQMLEAKSARREARGEAPLDVDAEMAALTSAAPASSDPGLREEVRQLVVARNERRARQGKPPLDVEAEVDRELRELGG